ncbi:small secreted protein [Actinacidiphila sp. ITFR-21]|uniref:small secreted protein n=1 Tax=Actinacidiphila sp. ITFR-21 TaxID=3075199 RepID=UPI00288A91DB|nr:small secreted protein [Streptomyces sp. ITFR-21]WNI16961.1 small secreted protein [Streptomyces sp. ITFR-21]
MKVNNRLLAALCGGSAVLLALSGCGSDDTGKRRDAWAKGVCDQAAGQIKRIDDANTAISRVDGGGRPQAVQTADSAAFQTISAAYRSLSGIFDAAGAAPGGDEGQKFQQNAVSVFAGLSSQYASLKKQVDGLDTRSQAKFADGLKGVSDSLNKTTASAQTSLDTLRQGDTGNALAKQPGCQQVSGSVSPSPSAS